MCKVLAIAGVKREHHAKIQELAKAAASEFNSTDGDGFGYAAITKGGEIYGEKWLRKDDVMVSHKNPVKPRSVKLIEAILGKAARLPEFTNEEVYMSFGTEMSKPGIIDDTVAFIFHARRKTTGEKSLVNTHPFYLPEDKTTEPTALIHNGSISNHEALTKIYSTCDSEVILHEYNKYAINYVPGNIEAMANALIGEYTSIVLSRFMDTEGKLIPYMDIFKSNKDLVVGYVKELDTLIYCTTKYALESICKVCNLTVENICDIEDGFLIRIDAETGQGLGDLISFEKSKKFEYQTHHHRNFNQNYPTHQPASLPAPRTDTGHTIKKMKEEFAKNHPEVFATDIVTVEPMSDKDLAILKEFESSNSNKHLRTLALVKNSIAARA